MANRFAYRTGISPVSPDYASGATKIMETAVEQKLADIEQKRSMATDSQKAALKAMSMQNIEGLSRQLQGKYQQDFDTHREKIVGMMREGGGVLSMPQQMEIENERSDIVSKTIASNNALKERNEVRKFMLDPNTQYGYNVEAILGELQDWDKSFEAGEYKGDPRTILFKHQTEAPMGDYVDRQYGSTIDRMDISAKGEWVDDNTFKFTSQEDEAEVDRLIDDVLTTDRRFIKEVQQVGYDRAREKVKDLFIKRDVKITPRRKYDASASGSKKELRALSPKSVDLASGTYTDYVDYPASQAEKRFTINRALNEETGREDTFDTAQSMRVIGFSPKDDKVFFVSEGGELKRDGERVLDIGNGLTEAEVKEGDNKVFTTLAKESKFGDSLKATRVENIDIKDNKDGSYTISGTVEKWIDKGILGTGLMKDLVKGDNLDTKKHKLAESDEVSVTVKPLMDEKATTRYSAPLSEYEEVVSELYQYGIEGEKVSDYYKSQRGKTDGGVSTYTVDGTTYEIPKDKEKAFLAKFPNAKKR